ncbi:hypothetical protein H6F90_00905 [Trichocoleus sp. FACHB-591]|uniref:hypothetical protein n=1 Tax=Trichocoleus sp. FACHB-591 TaxID=2692872 RepID=UPI00168971EA|nr:hypothetical protein [Trichocoleus sp. FACHB-591]MBD2093715.1 hypothetical protein [Trichocoleus sp. FACHB-591]
MLITPLHHGLTTAKPSKAQLAFWFSLSLTFAAIYGCMALQQAFSGEYVVQDDARQHVFWMQRFLDPELLPNDFIANYFQSVAPWGYTKFYQLFAAIGVHPFLLNKLLPIALGLVMTGYCFGFSLQLFPVPAASFLATLLLNQTVWMKDDLVTATPRAFLYPLFLAFLYYLLRRSLLPCLAAIALQGLFYPQILLISAGTLVLTLVRWENGRLGFSRDRQDYIFCVAGLAVTFVVLLPFVVQTSEYGSVIAPDAARQMPEFGEKGRSRFYVNDPWDFWLTAERSGFFPALWLPPLLTVGVLLPLLWRYRDRLPLLQQVQPQIRLLVQIFAASVGLFTLAHLLLFKLQLPSRYTHHSFRVITAIATGIVLITLFDALWRWATQSQSAPKQYLAIGIIVLVSAALLLYPSYDQRFPDTKYKEGQAPALYQFLQKTPKASLVASLSEEANFVPYFGQRPVLAGREYALPFHQRYYSQFRQRVTDLLQAQYSPNQEAVEQFIQQYGINFWLLDQEAFTPHYLASNRWFQQFQPAAREAQTRLEQGITPAIAQTVPRCTVFSAERLILLDAACISTR